MKLGTVFLILWTALVFAFILAPIVTLIVFSFNADRFPSLPWGGFSLEWYRAIFADATLGSGFRNSLTVAVVASLTATTLGFLTAYADYRFNFTGKLGFVALVAMPPTVPVVILGVANLTFTAQIGISGTLQAVMLGHIVFCTPFAMALIRIRLADLDPDIEKAAWNLGADRVATVRQVVIPFCRPAILSALAITAAVSFDEFMIAWFVSGIHETLPVRILALLQGQVSPRINAIGSLVFVVTITLVLLAQLALFSVRRAKTPRKG